MVREFTAVIGDEARGQCRDRSAPIPTWWWPAWAADPTRRDLRRVRRIGDTELVGVEPAGGAAVGAWRARRRPRQHLVPAAGRVRPGARGPVASPPGSTIRGSGPSTPTSRPSVGPGTSRSPTRRSSRRSPLLVSRPRASSPPSNPPTPSPGSSRRSELAGPTRSWSTSRVAATRTSPQMMTILGETPMTGPDRGGA